MLLNPHAVQVVKPLALSMKTSAIITTKSGKSGDLPQIML